ncbi:hypothetical protein EA709_16855 [Acinetobacter baumannii]|uniref:hypothetical protein n=1 Tax=Acinetobacter baumannii TaxID=470 RepID=UPI0002B97F82|nr:hypothetical protein [Acinetobacter baumannii]RSQ24259.1 hypothetical protein EA709_16855 [Acinetobacter baumannii]
MNLTDFQKKLIWGVGVLSIICLWIAFPLIFKALIESYKFPANFNSFGPFGDIYGSLNTLISSIALCAVAYSTWLQVTSLKETRRTNIKQLKLAEDSHNEQLNESRNAIFANQFYSLLNFKKDRLNNLSIVQGGVGVNGEKTTKFVPALHVIEDLAEKFIEILNNNNDEYKGLSNEMLKNKFIHNYIELGYGSISYLSSNFRIYSDLCNLIRDAKITKSDKDFYKSVLSNSMFLHEQILLFWIAPVLSDFQLEDSEIFTLFDQFTEFKNFALEFHKASHFKSESWKNHFNNK